MEDLEIPADYEFLEEDIIVIIFGFHLGEGGGRYLKS